MMWMGLMHEGVVPLERGMKGVLALSGNSILHQTKQHPSKESLVTWVSDAVIA